MRKEYPVLWLQGSGCSGCSVSVLNSVSPNAKNLLIDSVLPGKHINLMFHATLMAGQGEPAIEILIEAERVRKEGFILVVEGSIPESFSKRFATTGEVGGKPLNIVEHLVSLAKNASIVIALGTCSAFGGIPASHPNPTGCKGVSTILQEKGINVPLINIPGCPPHPDWFVGTIAHLLLFGFEIELDELARPKLFYGKLIHENCFRRPYFDKGKFAVSIDEPGCLYRLGCKGHYTYADCPLRQWNHGQNWCVRNGSPCLGCVEPEFPDGTSPFYDKIIAKGRD